MADKITGVILKDGVIRSETGQISGVNHSNAEEFFVLLKQKTGGEEVREARGYEGQEHSHSQDHDHQHE